MSIAMATFQGGRYLSEQLDSLAAQTHPPGELVISDDASTDDTRAIIDGFAGQAPFPVRMKRQARTVGILENFHAAFAGCSLPLICYCDQDDVWLPDKLARVAAAWRPGVALILHPSEVVDAALTTVQPRAPANPRYGVLPAPVAAHRVRGFGHQMVFDRAVLDVMIRLRDVADQVSPQGLAHDFDRYIPFCASLIGDCVILPSALVRFRRHERATSGAGARVLRDHSVVARAVWSIEQDRTACWTQSRILRAAAEQGLLDGPVAPRVAAALLIDVELAARQHALMSARSWACRARLWKAIVARTLAGGRFTNSRRARDLVLSVILAWGGQRGRRDQVR